jgi:hypothetical protein
MGVTVILYWNEVTAEEIRVEIKYDRSTRSEVLFQRAVRETRLVNVQGAAKGRNTYNALCDERVSAVGVLEWLMFTFE